MDPDRPNETRGFRCHTCGQWHDELPLDVGFDEPLYVDELSAEERAAQVTADGDFRVWNSADQGTHYFVRGVIEIPVLGAEDVFCYGVWSSLSVASYEKARVAYRANQSDGPFFGWLSNRLAGYPDTLGLKTDVNVRPDRKPSIVLHCQPHPLHVEQRDGITLDRVRDIVEPLMHPRANGSG